MRHAAREERSRPPRQGRKSRGTGRSHATKRVARLETRYPSPVKCSSQGWYHGSSPVCPNRGQRRHGARTGLHHSVARPVGKGWSRRWRGLSTGEQVTRMRGTLSGGTPVEWDERPQRVGKRGSLRCCAWKLLRLELRGSWSCVWYYVISTPVILNGGYIYTFTLFKRGQRACAFASVVKRSERRENQKETGSMSVSFWGF